MSATRPEWCLDFTDTVDWRTSDHPTDTVPGYGDLVAWSLKEGILTEDEATALGRMAQDDPTTTKEVMKRGRNLREAVYRIFSAVAHRRGVEAYDMDTLNEVLSKGLEMRMLRPAREGFEWTWKGSLPPDAMLFSLARSAADLLTSRDLLRVKECANEEQGCGSLFLDGSKTQTRRWCSMDGCGNRAKFRAYYARQKRLKEV